MKKPASMKPMEIQLDVVDEDSPFGAAIVEFHMSCIQFACEKFGMRPVTKGFCGLGGLPT